MSRKPPLTLVDPNATGAKPPRPLSGEGMALWRRVTAAYRIDDEGGIELLVQSCEAEDRLKEIAVQIKDDGLTIRSKTGLREHPLLKVELGLRAFIVRTLARLGIVFETVKTPGRPGGFACWTGDREEED
jgi:hypothetical protein